MNPFANILGGLVGGLIQQYAPGQAMKAAAWLADQSLGRARGEEAVAQAAPVIRVLADSAAHAAVISLDKAASAGGDVAAVQAHVAAALNPPAPVRVRPAAKAKN